MEAQSLEVKRAEVEFHKFVSLGEPERAIAAYAEENVRRGALIRAHQEFIRALSPFLEKHFAAHEYDVFVRERGWGQRWVKKLAVRLDPYRSVWRAAHLLGGTLSAVCRKDGTPPEAMPGMERFEALLRCPDCTGGFVRSPEDSLLCTRCGYTAPNEGGVYNLLPSAERTALCPGDREDIIDFSLPSHEAHLLEGWYGLEGVYGNKYRWMGPRASARLKRVETGPQRLRIRAFAHREPAKLAVTANGIPLPELTLHRPGLFIYEADLPEASEYHLTLSAAPTWSAPEDDRALTLIISLIRLLPR